MHSVSVSRTSFPKLSKDSTVGKLLAEARSTKLDIERERLELVSDPEQGQAFREFLASVEKPLEQLKSSRPNTLDLAPLLKKDTTGFWRQIKPLVEDPQRREVEAVLRQLQFPTPNEMVERTFAGAAEKIENYLEEAKQIQEEAIAEDAEIEKELLELEEFQKTLPNLLVFDEAQNFPEVAAAVADDIAHSRWDGLEHKEETGHGHH